MRHEGHRLFPPFRLDPVNAQLWKGDKQIILRPKTFEVLCYLVDHPGELVTKNTLLDTVWAGVTVSDSMPATCVTELRRALGDDPKTPKFVATVHRRGYRFIAPVRFGTTPEVKVRRPDAAKGPRPILVGRKEELAQLQGWYSQVLQGRRRIIFVAGEAGIGKTAFAQEFVSSIVAEGAALVGRGQCVEHYGAGEPYMPVLEALSGLSRRQGGERVVELLRQFAPTWLAQMPGLLTSEERARLQSEVQGVTQQRMLREMTELLEAITAESPLVLLLEDLHWSDFSTLELISAIARRVESARLLIVGTYRPVEMLDRDHPLRTVKQELELHHYCEELRLKLLNEKDIESYLTRRLAGNSGGRFETLGSLIHARTDGNPLFMVNVVDYLLGEAGLMVRKHEVSEWEALVATGFDPPRTIREMIERNFERLKPDERAVLEGASVVGAEFSAALVAAALERPQEEIEDCCTQLARREQFVSAQRTVTWPDGTIVPGFRFQHALYQQVLYRLLSVGHQVRFHQRIALREETGYGERASEVATELAFHYSRANDINKALRYFRLAAERSVARCAFTEAASQLKTAIDLVGTLPSDSFGRRMELDLQTMLGVTLHSAKGYAAAEAAGAFQRARELFQRAAFLGEDVEDPFLEFAGMYGLWANYYNACRPELLGQAQQFLAVAQARDARAPLLVGHRILGTSFLFLGEFISAREHLDQAVALYDPERHAQLALRFGQDIGVSALANRAWANAYLGYPEKAFADVEAALARARPLGHVPTLVYALTHAAIAEAVWRDIDRGEAHARQLVELSEKHGLPLWLGFGTMTLGMVLASRGQPIEAIEKIRTGLAIKDSTGCRLFKTLCSAPLGGAFVKMGQYEQALSAVQDGLAAVAATNERWAEAELHRQQGEVLLSLPIPDYTAAEESFLKALVVARRQNAKLYELRSSVSLARLWVKKGKRVEAYDLLNPIYHWFTKGLDTADLKDAKALLDQPNGGLIQKP